MPFFLRSGCDKPFVSLQPTNATQEELLPAFTTWRDFIVELNRIRPWRRVTKNIDY
jgi:hypothetical protein